MTVPKNSATCDDCGARIVLVPFAPDLTRPTRTPRDPKATSWVPLDPAPVPDSHPHAPYAASIGLTQCHLITDAWPLIPPERRHTVHHQTCRARVAAAAITGDDES